MSDRADVTVRHDADNQRWEAVVDGDVAGYISYAREGDVVDMQHTVVDDEWEGKGVGSALVRGALDDARSAGDHVRPSCPFVRSYIDDHDEYADLVA